LLVTDPATSPRRNLAKVVFGSMYGAGVFGLYALLGWLGVPTFYDKLLCVPPLNLTVRALDRMAAAIEARLPNWRLRKVQWSPRTYNFAHMSVWTALFAVMIGTGFLGQSHPGSSPDFWREACADGKRGACQTWAQTLGIGCQHGSAGACFALGLLLNEGRRIPRDLTEAGKDFARACDLDLAYGCAGLLELVSQTGRNVFQPACEKGDGESCFILASLAYAGRGVPQDYASAAALFRRSCDSGWWRGCGGLAECYRAGRGTALDLAQAEVYFEKACRAGVAPSCYSVAALYRDERNEALAQDRFRQACEASKRNQEANEFYFKARAGPARIPKFCAPVNP